MTGLRNLTLAWLPVILAATAVACSKDPEVAKREHFERGNGYYDSKKYNEAIVEYRAAIQADARFGEARRRLGEAYLQVDNRPQALREYVRAADLLATNIDAQIKAGGLLLLARRFEDAKGRAEKVLALDAKNVDGHILLGNALAGLKDLKAAIAEIEEAIQLDPKQSRGYLNLGLLEMAREKGAQAEQAFRKAVELDPKSVDATLALANFYWTAKRAAEAEQTLKAALRLSPKHPVANRALANYYLGSGRLAEAEPYLLTAAEDVTTAVSRLALADYYLATDRAPEAIAILDTLATHKESFTASKLRLAAIDYTAGRIEQAYQTIEEALAREPKNAEVMLLKGRLLLAEKKFDLALATVQEAAIADPRSIHAHYTLGLIHTAKHAIADATKSFNDVLKLNPRAVAAQLQLSRLHLTRGSAATAVQFAEEAVRNLPRNAEARLTLARGLIASGQIARAEAELNPLVKQFPKAAAVQVQLGTLHLAKKNSAAARRAFDRALELDRNSVDALAGLLALDVAARRVADARTRIDDRLAERPTDAALLILAAHTYAAAGDLPNAETVLRRAIDSDPSRLEPYAMLGQLYVGQQRLDEALKEFDEVSKREANSIGAHTMVGTILHIQNKVAEARNRYERVLAIDRRSPVAANNLAWLYAESGGNLDVAVDLALAARAALPDHPAVSDTLGWVYYKKDRAQQAIAPLRESVAKEPQNPVYHFHLGLAYAKAGEPAKARIALEQALKLQPDFPGADEARRTLVTVKG